MTAKHDDDQASVTIGVIIGKGYVDRIDQWARKLHHSRSKMARIVLECSIEDEGWMWRLITSGPGLALMKLLYPATFSRPLDDEEELVISKFVAQASPAGLLQIIERCGDELRKREKQAA